MIYDGRRQGLVEWEGQNQAEIELNDASRPVSRLNRFARAVPS